MSFKTLMIIKAAVCLVFGLLLLIVPGPLLTLMGASYCSAAALTARKYGAALMGNLMLTWFARSAEPTRERRAITLDLFVYDPIGLVATLVILLSGNLNWLGWGVAFIYLFFTVGFGLFLLQRTKPA